MTTTFTEIRDRLYLLMYLTEDANGNRISGVSKNIYMDALPTTMPTTLTDCVMLDFESSITDLAAYGYGTLRVWLLVPDSDTGAMLSVLENNFHSTVAEYKNSQDASVVEFNKRFAYAHYDDTRMLRGLVMELKVKIKS